MIKEIQDLTTHLETVLEIKYTVLKRIEEVYDERDKLCDSGINSDEEADLEVVYENQGMHLENITKLLNKIDKECKKLRELAEVYPEAFK